MAYKMKHEHKDFPFKEPVGPTADINKKPVSEKTKKIQHDMWNLEDKMKDTGVFNITRKNS